MGGYFGTWMAGGRAADAPLSRHGLAGFGARPGCGLVAPLPEGVCAMSEVASVARWYAANSAGQCGACMFGLADIAGALQGILQGDREAEVAARRWTEMVRGRGACQFPDGAAAFVDSALDVFTDELADHRRGCCCRPYRGYLPVPAPGGWR